MATRPKATKDLRIAQGKRRDAYFERLRRQAQPKKAAAATAPGAPPAAAGGLAAPAPAAEPSE